MRRPHYKHPSFVLFLTLVFSPFLVEGRMHRLSACEREKGPAGTSLVRGNRPHPALRQTAFAHPEWGLLYSVEGLTDYNNQCTPTLTADNRMIVFTYSDVNGPAQIPRGIAVATWNDAAGRWNPPVSTGLLGSRPFVSPEGTRIYYHADDDIYLSTWTGSQWSPGESLSWPINSPYRDTEPGLSLDGRKLYFSSDRPGGEGDNDIWVVRWNGVSWDSLTNLGQPVNTSYYEGWPRETADGQYLYFASWNRDEYGWGDIWVSEWTGWGWGEPVNLGPPINTEKTACSPFVTWDMMSFYCGSEANEGGMGEEDIWVAGPPQAQRKHDPPHSEAGGWEATDDLEDAQFVYCLLEASGGILYAGTYPYGDVFKSSDKGTHWVNTSELDGALRVYSLLEAYDGTIYAGTYPNGDIFKTSDGGETWQPTADLTGAASVHCMLQAEGGAVYAGTAPGIEGPGGGGRIFRSTNGGGDWELITPIPDLDEAVLALMQTGEGVFFAGGLHPQSIARSHDAGMTWESSPLRYPGDIRALLEASDGSLWAAGWAHAKKGRVYTSTDDGVTWDTTAVVMIGEHNASRHFAIVEAEPGVIFTAIQTGPDSVVHRTTDGGKTWTSAGALAGTREALCLLRASDGAIYAGTTPHGDVFKLSPTGIGTDGGNDQHPIPFAGSLSQNYPNPFNPHTTVSYSLPEDAWVEISIYDLLGKRVKTLLRSYCPAGDHRVEWDGRDEQGTELAGGIYFLRLSAGDVTQTRKMIFLQ